MQSRVEIGCITFQIANCARSDVVLDCNRWSQTAPCRLHPCRLVPVGASVMLTGHASLQQFDCIQDPPAYAYIYPYIASVCSGTEMPAL